MREALLSRVSIYRVYHTRGQRHCKDISPLRLSSITPAVSAYGRQNGSPFKLKVISINAKSHLYNERYLSYTSPIVMSVPPPAESAESRELNLVGKVELRIALIDSDVRLEAILKTYLPPLLLKLASEYISVRNKVSQNTF